MSWRASLAQLDTLLADLVSSSLDDLMENYTSLKRQLVPREFSIKVTSCKCIPPIWNTMNQCIGAGFRQDWHETKKEEEEEEFMLSQHSKFQGKGDLHTITITFHTTAIIMTIVSLCIYS